MEIYSPPRNYGKQLSLFSQENEASENREIKKQAFKKQKTLFKHRVQKLKEYLGQINLVLDNK